MAGSKTVLYSTVATATERGFPGVKTHDLWARCCPASAALSRRAGRSLAEAPAGVLDRMLTVRVHLDAMTDANGPLRVVPGSHRADVPTDAAGDVRCDAGDAVLMRPRLLHASAHCPPGHTGHRRVVHLELADGRELPDGYEWHTFERVGGGVFPRGLPTQVV